MPLTASLEASAQSLQRPKRLKAPNSGTTYDHALDQALASYTWPLGHPKNPGRIGSIGLGRDKMRAFILIVVLAGMMGGEADADTPPAKMTASNVEKAMALIERWVGGNYSTKAQYEADQASNKPDNEKHRMMYQLFKRVDVPGFEGTLFFEQGSRDGSTDPDMIWRSGLVQVIADKKLGVVRYRELAFKDQKPWHNAHMTPQKFQNLTRDQVTWDENCDFLVTLSADNKSIGGPIPKMKCSRINDGTGEKMYADDAIVIKPGEFWFLGRYVDAKGQHLWGNESDELNKLVKFAEIP